MRHLYLLFAVFATLILGSTAAMYEIYQGHLELLAKQGPKRMAAIPWTASMLEREAMRVQGLIVRTGLEMRLQGLASAPPEAFDELHLRVEVLRSRWTEAGTTGEGITLAKAAEGGEQTLAELDEFLRYMEEATSGDDPGRVTPGFLREAEARFAPLERSIRLMAQNAQIRSMKVYEERAADLLEQQRLSFAAALLQALLSLAFLVAGVRFLRIERDKLALRRQVEAAERRQQAADEANRAKSTFLANISHELRTPVHGILGMLHLALHANRTPQVANYLQAAQKSTRHLMGLLNDLLDATRIEHAKLELHPEPVLLRELLDEIEPPLQAQAALKQIGFHLHRGTALPDWVELDGKRVKQVLFNLIGNAVKFTPEGSVAVEVTATRVPGEAVVLLSFVVQDTGIGMSEATLAKLFTRFHQADDSASRPFGGAGLGLEISQKLAQKMNGRIDVASRLGEGSTFTFTVRAPLARPPHDALSPEAARLQELEGLRVLVAEDDEVGRKYLAALMGELQVAAAFARNGRQAVEIAEREAFDLILMDLHMPEMDGWTAATEIRRQGANMQTPIIAMTADVFERSRSQAAAAGMDDFTAKPIERDTLVSVLLANRTGARAGRLPVQAG